MWYLWIAGVSVNGIESSFMVHWFYLLFSSGLYSVSQARRLLWFLLVSWSHWHLPVLICKLLEAWFLEYQLETVCHLLIHWSLTPDIVSYTFCLTHLTQRLCLKYVLGHRPFWKYSDSYEVIPQGKRKIHRHANGAFNFVGYKDPLKAINRLQVKNSSYTVKMLCHLASQMRTTLKNTNN